jgi:hypothetical protein
MKSIAHMYLLARETLGVREAIQRVAADIGRPAEQVATALGFPEKYGRFLYAGGDDVEPVQPHVGLKAWTTYPDSGHLERIKILTQHASLDGHTAWSWRWLTGPSKGTTVIGYGRSFWRRKGVTV